MPVARRRRGDRARLKSRLRGTIRAQQARRREPSQSPRRSCTPVPAASIATCATAGAPPGGAAVDRKAAAATP